MDRYSRNASYVIQEKKERWDRLKYYKYSGIKERLGDSTIDEYKILLGNTEKDDIRNKSISKFKNDIIDDILEQDIHKDSN